VAPEGKSGGLGGLIAFGVLVFTALAWWETHRSREQEDSKIKREIQTQAVKYVRGVPSKHDGMIEIDYKNSGEIPFTVIAAKAELEPQDVDSGEWGHCAVNLARIRMPFQPDNIAEETPQGGVRDIAIFFPVPNNCLDVKGRVKLEITYQLTDHVGEKFERAGEGVMDFLEPKSL
jgi:hypothetical protein